jgi:putative intracellular protease/amidase
MQIAIPLFDRFAALDAVGPHQVLTHLPGAKIIFCSERPRGVCDDSGFLTLVAEAAYADLPSPDLILVPGGPGQADHMTPGPLQDWLLEADKTSTWTTSVCTGALALAARIAGDEVAQQIQLGIEYDPHPPFNAGAAAVAPPEVVAALRGRSRFP